MKTTNDNENLLLPPIKDSVKNIETEAKNVINITPDKDIIIDKSDQSKNQPNPNFYNKMEMEKEFKYNKATEDHRETESITNNLREKLNARYTSPKNDARSNYTNSRLRNYMGYIESKEVSISSFRDRYKAFGESKASLETNLELANKKCEIYEKEINLLRQNLIEMKTLMSRTNEEAYKLEISRLKQSLSMKEKENKILSQENVSLKRQIKKHEENTNQLIEDNKSFRIEAQKKFWNYNKEIENLMNKINELSKLKSQEINKEIKEEKHKKEDHEPSDNKQENDMIYNYKEINDENINNSLTKIIMTNSEKSTELKVEDQSNYMNLNTEFIQVTHYDNNDYNALTNGNPNIIEEVGSDNYINMNGNIYDELKDLKFEDENLCDNQYYDNTINMPRQVNNNKYNQLFETVDSDIQTSSKKPNTGDNFNYSNNENFRGTSDNDNAESGATNNIFNRNIDL